MLYLLCGSGLIILFSGSWLSCAGQRYFRRPHTIETCAGFLIIVGVACIGATLGFLFGPPLP
jgi:hypothetical protein